MSDDRWRREEDTADPEYDDSRPPDAPYDLPDIVPATVDVPVEPSGPQLPPRQRVASADAPPPAVAMPSTQRVSTAPAVVGAVARPVVAPGVAGPLATSWGDHMPVAAMAPAPPMSGGRPDTTLRATGRRPRVRRVTRVVRHVDPWSVFKVALVFNVVGYLVVLTAGVLLWRVADSTGTIDNVERWFTQFGWETFELKGGEIFSNAWIIGLFMAVGLTGAAVLTATLFNLVSDIVGGMRVTVLEEEVVERTAASTRRYVVRRPPIADAAITGSTQWAVDDDESPPERPERPASSEPLASSTARAATVTTPSSGADWTVDDDLPL